MRACTRSEAYQIFQVLNDRGVQLTDSDLLRAPTMEVLDGGAYAATQEKLASAWDEVLAYGSEGIDKYLKWYFSSQEGKRPSASELTDQFLDARFNVSADTSMTKARATSIVNEVEELGNEFAILKKDG